MSFRIPLFVGIYLLALLFVTEALPTFKLLPVSAHSWIDFIGLGTLAAIALFVLSIKAKRRTPSSLTNVTSESADETLELYLKTIESLAVAIDAKDQTTHGHVRRTQVYAMELGKLLNLSPLELKALFAGAMLHDIGKLAVPDFILNKPGKLTEAEFAKMKVHPTVGADILKRVNFPFPVEDVVRYHHERWDGSGYPEGLKGSSIPLVARIISVVDFYDTTRCDRPYRKGMTQQESLALLTRMAGSGFDPEVVDTFVKHVAHFDSLIPFEDLNEQISSVSSSNERADQLTSSARIQSKSSECHTAALQSISAVQREVTTLHEMLQTLGASLNLSDTLNLVGSKLASLVPFDSCVIYLVEGKGTVATARYAQGTFADYFLGKEIRQREGISGWVISNGTTMFDAPADAELVEMPAEVQNRITRVMSTPLISNGECFGAITLYGQKAAKFSAEEAELLEVVARHAAFAINNALTFEKTREGALTDSLTQLPNLRAFQMVIEQRLAQCRRSSGEQLALLYINLDDFRSINKCYGHNIGDRILGEVAEMAKNELRQMDMLTRHPGDLFVAIMPSASLAVARRVADRVRLVVESKRFPVRAGKTIELELSVGVSSYPGSGESASELLAAACRDMAQNRELRRRQTPNTTAMSLEAIST